MAKTRGKSRNILLFVAIFLILVSLSLIFFRVTGNFIRLDGVIKTSSGYDLVNETAIIEDLGGTVSAATLSGSLVFTHPLTNETHYIYLYYEYANRATVPYQILDINLNNGSYTLVDGGYGRPDPMPMVVHPTTGIVYIGSQSPGELIAYNTINATAVKIHDLPDNAGVQNIAIGDDLAIYLGGCIKGILVRYDPLLDPGFNGTNESWRDYGIVNDPGSPYYRYIYTLGSDGNYTYMAIRNQYDEPYIWSFVVKDVNTGEEKVYFNDSAYSYVEAYSSRRGYGVGCTFNNTDTMVCYKFEGFSPPESIDRYNLSGNLINVTFPPLWADTGFSTFNLSDNSPDSSNNGSVFFEWKKPNEQNWTNANVSGIRMENVPLKGVYSTANSTLIGFPSAYVPTFLYDFVQNRSVVLGRTGMSFYNALYSQIHKKWYLVGYPSAWAEYDPNLAWTAKGYTLDRSTNPHWMPQSPGGISGKYYYYVAEDYKGYIYLGGHHERDSSGGSLHWYDPVTNDSGALRTPFLLYDVSGLTSAVNKTKIILGSYSCCGQTGPGKLFVINADTHEIEREITPTNATSAGTIIEVETGKIFGFTRELYYKVNIFTGEIIFVKVAPGTISSYRKMPVGPDGYIYAYVGNTIYRFNPIDGEIEKVIDAPPAAAISFDNTTMYISGNEYTNIRKVSNIFAFTDNNSEVIGNCETSCIGDCPACFEYISETCGNGICNAEFGESCSSCSSDCGSCSSGGSSHGGSGGGSIVEKINNTTNSTLTTSNNDSIENETEFSTNNIQPPKSNQNMSNVNLFVVFLILVILIVIIIVIIYLVYKKSQLVLP